MLKKNLKTIGNLVLFKVGWLSCVLFGASHYHLLGSVIVAFICVIAVRTSEHPMATAKLIMVACGLGFLWESMLIFNGLMVYEFGHVPGELMPAWLAPHWIVAMWALFASTLDHSMSWLKRNLFVGALFGAIGGPIAFLAGERLGAVTMPDTTTSLIALCCGWAILTPSLLWLSNNLNASAEQVTLVNQRSPLPAK